MQGYMGNARLAGLANDGMAKLEVKSPNRPRSG